MPAPLLLRDGVDARIAGVAAGQRHTLLRTTRGGVLSFGAGGAGQLGRAADEQRIGFMDGFEERDEEPLDTDSESRDEAVPLDESAQIESDSAPIDVDLDDVALLAPSAAVDEDEAPTGAQQQSAEPARASGVAAGGMFSLVWQNAPSDEQSGADEPALPFVDVGKLRDAIDADKRRQEELKERIAALQMVHALDGALATSKSRFEWFQSQTHVNIEIFVDGGVSTVGGELWLSADGTEVKLALRQPRVLIRVPLSEAVSEVQVQTVPATGAPATLAAHGTAPSSLTVAAAAESGEALARGRKLVLKCKKADESKQWSGIESARVAEERAAAAGELEKHSQEVGARIVSLLERRFATLASANASFNCCRDTAGMLWFFERLCLQTPILSPHERAAVLDTMQRCALDLSDQLVQCATSSLAPTAHAWEHAARALVPLLMAPTTSLESVRAHNTRKRIVETMSRLSGARRKQVFDWLGEFRAALFVCHCMNINC